MKSDLTPPEQIYPTPEQLQPDYTLPELFTPEQKQMFEQIAEVSNYHFREMTRYESYLKPYRDLNNVVAHARMKGEQRGLEKAREKREAEMTIEIARRGLKGNISPSLIAELTGLSEDEIAALQPSLPS